jgi:hypothetical protein
MLRQFAGLLVLFLGAVAAWQGLLAGRVAWAAALGVAAVTIGPLGLWKPRWLRPIYVGWMVAVFPVGWVVTKAMLIVIFYLVFTPLGLFLRAMGHDALALRRPNRPSYWTEIQKPDDIRRYFRQY